MAYIGESVSCIKESTNDSSILDKSAVVEHGMNILLKNKVVLFRKKQALKLSYVGCDSD